MGLDRVASTPLLGVVSRFTHQKGLDLVLTVAQRIVDLPAQIAVLGSGDRQLEDQFRALGDEHSGAVGVRVGFDEKLSHVIEAGADIFLMPSRFEPSGLNQMYSQRYGTPVVGHATGGLVDTIVDCVPENISAGTATGFLFHEATPEAFFAAVVRAVEASRNRRLWRALQRNGMARDYSWDAAAQRYVALYEALAPNS
jgi:starch synthase